MNFATQDSVVQLIIYTQFFCNVFSINVATENKSGKIKFASAGKSGIYLLYLWIFCICQSLINSRITVPCIISRHYAPGTLSHINVQYNDRCVNTLLNVFWKSSFPPLVSSCPIHIWIESKRVLSNALDISLVRIRELKLNRKKKRKMYNCFF